MIEIASHLGVHRTTVSEWWRQDQQQKETDLHQQKRGNRWGEGRTLTPTEEVRLRQRIRENFPDELNINGVLWTRSAVQGLIACECGIGLPIRTVGEYLKHWGYTPQKPLKHAYKQDPQRVKALLEVQYEAIEQQAQQENAEIAWEDESGLRSDAQVRRGYAPIGQTPEIQPSTQRVSVNYLASVSNQGKVRFMLYTQKLTAQMLITFPECLIAKRARTLMWIVDRHPVLHSTTVQQSLQQHRDKIEMHFLPPYFPELNPAEYLNGDVKQWVHSKPPTRNLVQLEYRLRSHLFKLQKLAARIIKYFQHPSIAYAA